MGRLNPLLMAYGCNQLWLANYKNFFTNVCQFFFFISIYIFIYENKKKLTNISKKFLYSYIFKPTIHTNLKTVNFLDVTLNLANCTYEPYKKDNDTPIYIHTSSNHPPSITKQIQKSISHRLSNNSTNIDIFNKHIYDKALKHSGYKQELKFTPPKDKSKHRWRNIIWFNPPYNKCISSNIGRDFLNLISKYFPNNSSPSQNLQSKQQG